MNHTNYDLLLELQWPRNYGHVRDDMTLHGAACLDVPEHVRQNRAQSRISLRGRLKRKLVDRMIARWPDLRKFAYGNIQDYYFFWSEQWYKHGQFSGLNAESYFERVLDLFDRLPTDSRFGMRIGFAYRPSSIVRSIRCQIGVDVEIRGRSYSGVICFEELRVTVAYHGSFRNGTRWISGAITGLDTDFLLKA